MTRENKVALVVGFGLVLLVGILISDHLANARTPQPPDLVPARADGDAPALDLRLVDLSGRRETALPPEPAPQRPQATPVAPPEAVVTLPAEPPAAPDRTPATVQTPTVQAPTPKDPVHAASGDKIHAIQAGDTLARICQGYYGTGSLAAALATYNGLADPDHVVTGRSLRIPPAQTLGGAGAAKARTGSEPKTAAAKTYTVKPNETLSEIAQRLLGSARRWEELFELNSSVLTDPDDIRAGMQLQLP